MAWSWDFMLLAFTGLGGKVHNVIGKPGPDGYRLVPVIPDNKVLVEVPQNLLFPLSDIEFVDGSPRIKGDSAIGGAERTFFTNYFESFSWGSGGRAQATAFIGEIDRLPTTVRTMLSNEFGVERWLDGGEARAQRWFLESRSIGFRGTAVLAPLLDLVRHSSSAARFVKENSIAVQGTFADQLMAERSNAGAFNALWRFGAPSPEPVAYSVPMTFKMPSGELVIGQHINHSPVYGAIPIPKYEVDGGTLLLSGLMIGNSRAPRVPRGILDRIFEDAGFPNSHETFDFIAHHNRLAYLRLLEAMESTEGGLIPALRKAVRCHLEAMSWSIGTREI